MNESLDEKMMGLALRASRRGRPSPNPHVGAVVARGEQVIAVGHHARAGEPHAEIGALRRAGAAARGGTLYVTFEPCNHHGRTPPCTEAIVAAGIKRVVVGCADPAPHVPGATDRLRAAGIAVTVGVRESEARERIADFAKHITSGVPWVTMKAAVSLDGRLAARTGQSRWLTGPRARAEAHRLRRSHDAVLVGIGTGLADDPALTVRHVRGADPLRVVLDTHLRLRPDARLLTEADRAPTLIFHGASAPADRRASFLTRSGVTLQEVNEHPGGLDIEEVLRELARRDVVRLLVEGGAKVHGSLLSGGWVDEVALFIAPKIFADCEAIPLASGRTVLEVREAIELESMRTRRLGEDLLVSAKVRRAPAPRGSREARTEE